MATITAANIIDKAKIVLQDLPSTRWTSDELLGWLNDGQREIVKLKPETSITSTTVTCVAGTKQTLPDDGIVFIKVTRNMAEESNKQVVRLIDMHTLDDMLPGWHAMDGSINIEHYGYEPTDPKHFYVYPPALATAELELIYSSAPTDCATVDSTISVDDVYANGLKNYILYMAYLKDADYAANNTRALGMFSAFMQGLSSKQQAETANEPRGSRPQQQAV